MIKKILVVLILLAIIGGGVGYYLFTKKVPGLEDVQADYKLSADELYDQLSANEQEATAKYSDKVIEVSGKIISASATDTTYVVILKAVNSDMGGINCSFKPVPADAGKNLVPEKSTSLKGRFVGFDDLFGSVQLKDCVPAQ